MIERIHGKQYRLKMIYFERLIDSPLELQGIALHFGGLNGVRDLAIGAQQAASINFEPVLAAHQPEFDGEPEKSRHGSKYAAEAMHSRLRIADARDQVGCGVRALPEAD